MTDVKIDNTSNQVNKIYGPTQLAVNSIHKHNIHSDGNYGPNTAQCEQYP
jgi:hypothetical protein